MPTETDILAADTLRGAASEAPASTSDVARFLQDNLGPRLTAHIADIGDHEQVGKWAAGEIIPLPASEQRLRAALSVIQLIQNAESLYTARAWMIGMNPQLEDQAPAQCIADGRERDVLVAARAYVDGC
ncbi:XRE family transcriptional regulator [Streptomyces sp. NPDC048603]|uniref:XRE family transcriptional regulator n=1 Tax=Streptomyces sp. NPDC048603 TaxID=3365577 RepID=UPI00371573F3